jgi:hypothetical protein
MTRLLGLPFLLALTIDCALAQGPPPTPEAPATVISHYLITPSSEPGRRLVIEGQVFAPDGVTTAPGVIIYAYQTDDTGEYHNDQNGIARLHGWVRTDENGRFEFRTSSKHQFVGKVGSDAGKYGVRFPYWIVFT